MSDEQTVLTSDDRPITEIWQTVPDGFGYQVGRNCDLIEAYAEHGHMGMIPWIRVLSKGEVIMRVAADHVSVHYA